jgi:nucleotide-binding universal stress UspA family protein
MEMAMKNILLLVHDDTGQEARLQAALDLTRALDGHLQCVDVTAVPVVVDAYAGNGGALIMDSERDQESRNKARLESRLAREDVPWDWTDVIASLRAGVLDAAALADIIVLNSGLGGFPSMREIASQIVMRSRKPILAVPDTLKHLALGRALIAWDGQTSSATTLRACVPILALAEEVKIFMVRDRAERTDPSEAAEYLSRHDIHASVQVIEGDLRSPEILIEEECANWAPDYVLMGAYGRGRLIETFGGVTKYMLGSAKWPLILGH